MWRRASSHLQTLAVLRSTLRRDPPLIRHRGRVALLSSAALRRTSPLLTPIPICYSIREGDAPAKKRVEDVMSIATGLEREELEAEFEVLYYRTPQRCYC
uniref:Uncharacterized protein n=1 Tax=Ananas comosus var. bracteatus TaxID=296719 RepID=A0A6V7QAQ8_ANACO|nr:unnamed protein product [Ananas comosus var. bracteatus]